ncbi:MAG: VWA domain-containing protein [Leptolyngbyaceae cyanobacterium MO_188.B28]|nr:VWA domain-containing protein [Leptolyngbyaceae cyanobacterium MO_188.B28]
MPLPNLPPDLIQKVNEDRQYHLLVDESASMNTGDCPGGSRWITAKEIVGLIALEAQKYDADGKIGLTFFGNNVNRVGEVTAAEVPEKFPAGAFGMATKLGAALDAEFKAYFTSGSDQPVTYIVLTDGEASDKQIVKQALKNAADACGNGDKIAVGIWQIGYDSTAAAFLQYLDDNLGEIDITDTQPMDSLITNLGNIGLLMAAAVVD